MKVVLSLEALDDFEAIAIWIAADNPPRAASFVDELQDRCRSLESQPKRFPVVSPTRRGDLHKLTHAGYLIFYLVFDSRIEIVRIVHGARDWAAIVEEIQ